MYNTLFAPQCLLFLFILFPLLIMWTDDLKQINMKGLDGLQGPIYVGTGCVFRRQALYGYDAPKKKKPPSRTCNCWPKWCCFCCGFRKNRKGKSTEKTTKRKSRDSLKQIHALENIEKGLESKHLFINRVFKLENINIGG